MQKNTISRLHENHKNFFIILFQKFVWWNKLLQSDIFLLHITQKLSCYHLAYQVIFLLVVTQYHSNLLCTTDRNLTVIMTSIHHHWSKNTYERDQSIMMTQLYHNWYKNNQNISYSSRHFAISVTLQLPSRIYGNGKAPDEGESKNITECTDDVTHRHIFRNGHSRRLQGLRLLYQIWRLRYPQYQVRYWLSSGSCYRWNSRR